MMPTDAREAWVSGLSRMYNGQKLESLEKYFAESLSGCQGRWLVPGVIRTAGLRYWWFPCVSVAL